MEIDYGALKVGTPLVRAKGFGIEHHALYVGKDTETGEHLVAENQICKGVQFITLKQFRSEGKLLKVDYKNFSIADQKKIIQKTYERIGANYDLLSYNCEHFVNDILNDKIESKQVDNFATLTLIGLGIVGLVLVLPNNEPVKSKRQARKKK